MRRVAWSGLIFWLILITACTSSTPSRRTVATRIKVYGDCTAPTLEPNEMVLSCADHNWLLENLRWDSWTNTRATAIGDQLYNDCTPDCATGHVHDIPGTRVTLTAPVRDARGQAVWSKLQLKPWMPGYETGPLAGGPFPLPTQPG